MATTITFGQVVPDGTYRIRSAVKTDHYLELEEDPGYNVRPMPNSASDFQKWQIKGNTEVNTYTIANVGGNLNLSVRPDKDVDGNPISRIDASPEGSQWTLEPRADQWVIGYAENKGCIDYSGGGTSDWLLLWDRNNQIAQRWVIEPVVMGAPVAAESGKIKVVNNSSISLQVMVSNWSNLLGNGSFFTVNSGASESWDRGGNEVVIFSSATTEPTGVTTSVFVPSKHVVRFMGFGHPGVFVSQ